jgi:SAM-dependent methyltransferase
VSGRQPGGDGVNPAPTATTWGAGRYELMAERLESAAAEIVDLAAITPGDTVLDLACGTGNAALLAARSAERVVGVDLEPRLLELATARARPAGSAIEWICADALSPELPAYGYSVVLSAFGVMYVPDQAAAAAALARVSAPGARIVVAVWTPGSFMATMGSVLGAYLPPPPPGSAPPSRWGDAEAVATLLRPHGLEVRVARRASLRLSFADGTQARRFLIETAGHVISERRRLENEGLWTELEHDLDQFVRERNGADSEAIGLDCEYLIVFAVAGGG